MTTGRFPTAREPRRRAGAGWREPQGQDGRQGQGWQGQGRRQGQGRWQGQGRCQGRRQGRRPLARQEEEVIERSRPRNAPPTLWTAPQKYTVHGLYIGRDERRRAGAGAGAGAGSDYRTGTSKIAVTLSVDPWRMASLTTAVTAACPGGTPSPLQCAQRRGDVNRVPSPAVRATRQRTYRRLGRRLLC